MGATARVQMPGNRAGWGRRIAPWPSMGQGAGQLSRGWRKTATGVAHITWIDAPFAFQPLPGLPTLARSVLRLCAATARQIEIAGEDWGVVKRVRTLRARDSSLSVATIRTS